jgi:hypothetical protein
LAQRLLMFQDYYEALARPFQWTFTRADLQRLLAHLPDAVRLSHPACDDSQYVTELTN